MTLTRELHLANPYMHGPDVLAAQQLLIRHGFGPGVADGVFGPDSAEAARRAKWTLGYPASSVNGIYGALLDGYLQGRPVPRGYVVTAQQRAQQDAKHWREVRASIVAWWSWAVAHESQIHWKEIRPFPLADMIAQQLPFTTDCSGSTEGSYAFAGAPNPSGPDEPTGYGFTGSILAFCRHIHRAQAKVGDPYVYGLASNYEGEHVAVMVLDDGDPLMASHGHESGKSPEFVRQSVLVSSIGAGTWLTCMPS